MPSIFEHLLTVDADSIDTHGHANNIAYVRWMQDAAVAHSAAAGFAGDDYARAGFGWFVRSHQITYLAQANQGDRIVVRTWVENFRAFRSLRKYEFYRLAPSADAPAEDQTDAPAEASTEDQTNAPADAPADAPAEGQTAPGETLLATAETDWVFVDLATGKPKKITPELINAFTNPKKISSDLRAEDLQ